MVTRRITGQFLIPVTKECKARLWRLLFQNLYRGCRDYAKVRSRAAQVNVEQRRMEKLTSEQNSTTERTASHRHWGDKPAIADEMSAHLRPIIRQLRRQLEELNGSILDLERMVGKRSGSGR